MVRAALIPFNPIRRDEGTARFLKEYPKLVFITGTMAVARGDCRIVLGAQRRKRSRSPEMFFIKIRTVSRNRIGRVRLTC
jgi:hypothetical protein